MVARREAIPDRSTVRVTGQAMKRGTGFAGGVPAWLPSLWPLLLPLPTVLLASWVIVAWKFNGLYGQDPFAYYDYGVGPLRRSVLTGAPLPALYWPLGYPILITLASLVLGPVTAAGQVVNVLAAAASVCLTYLLGRDLLRMAGADPRLARRAGALGAVLLGMTGRLVESSVLTMADAVALTTALLSAWALVRWSAGAEQNHPRAGWLALSSTALAWSVVTRWGQAALALAWLIALLPAVRARHWRALPWAVVPAAIVLGAQFWLVFTVRPAADLGPLPFAGDLVHVNGAESGWSLLHLFQRSFVNADGVQRYALPNGLFYASGPFLLQYLTPLFFPFTLLGLVVAAMSYRRSLLLLLSWPALLLLLVAGLDEQNPRFILAALPPIAILAGLGVAVIWDRLPGSAQDRPWERGRPARPRSVRTNGSAIPAGQGACPPVERRSRRMVDVCSTHAPAGPPGPRTGGTSPKRSAGTGQRPAPPGGRPAFRRGYGTLVHIVDHLRPRWRPLAATVLAASLIVVAMFGVRVLATLNGERNADLRVSAWAAARLPARATTLSFGLTLTLQHATDLHVLDLSVLSRRDLTRLIARRHPLYLLVQVGAMKGQFAARPPGRNYRFLSGNPGLTRLGTLHGYTLARVGSSHGRTCIRPSIPGYPTRHGPQEIGTGSPSQASPIALFCRPYSPRSDGCGS